MAGIDKKIYCVSTIGGLATGITASWRKGRLSIVSVDTYGLGVSNYQSVVTEIAKDRVKKGFFVFIEEGFTTINVKGAYAMSMSTLDELEKTTLVNVAMRQYRAMVAGGLIMFSPKAGNVSIPQSDINEVIDDKGAVSYQLDWNAIQSKHRALLLVIYAVASNNPAHLPTMKALFKCLAEKAQAANPFGKKGAALDAQLVSKEQQVIASRDLADITNNDGVPEGWTHVQ